MKLNIIISVIATVAALGIILVICKAFGVVTISWELAVTPVIVAAISLIITIFLVTFNYLQEK